MAEIQLDRQQIDELRELLEQRRTDLENLLENTGDAAKPVPLDQQSVGRVSRIDAIQQQQMAAASQAQTSAGLRRVEQALKRIDDEEFGFCLQCGEAIAFARLQVQPEAGLCLACQSENEKG